MIENGADVNAKDKDGVSALMLAASLGFIDMIDLLTSKGANTSDALIDAITIGQEDIAKSMIENGADVNAKNKYGFSALTLAASKGLIDTVNLLVVKGADTAEALLNAIVSGQETTAGILIEKGADVNANQRVVISALMLAASKGMINTVNLLVAKGADTAEALLNAISRGQEKTAGILIERGADVNAKNKYGVSALMLAASLRLTNTVNLLIAKGADTGDSDFFHNGNSFCDESLG